jgi:hypothetical protein
MMHLFQGRSTEFGLETRSEIVGGIHVYVKKKIAVDEADDAINTEGGNP